LPAGIDALLAIMLKHSNENCEIFMNIENLPKLSSIFRIAPPLILSKAA
jgi:hypothetical protein